MTYPITIRRAARAEYDEAVDWYEQKRLGLGADFVRRVKEKLALIAAPPLMNAVMFRDVRKAIVSRFPYSIYYRVAETKVIVIAIFHSNREPRNWQSRS